MSHIAEGLQEGLEVTVIEPRAQSGIRHVGQFIFGRRATRIVIPRPLEARGNELYQDEVEAIAEAVPHLVTQLPQKSRPLTTGSNPDQMYLLPGSVEVRRVKQPSTGRRIARAIGIDRNNLVGVRHGNVTQEYERLRQQGSILHSPIQDSTIEDAAQKVVAELRKRGIFVPEDYVAKQIQERAEIVQKHYEETILDKITFDIVPKVIEAVGKVVQNIPLLKHLNPVHLAENTARQAEIYAGITGGSAEVGPVGMAVGAIQELTSIPEDMSTAGVLDAITDSIIAWGYRHLKFPKRRVFGKKINTSAIYWPLRITGLIPVIPSIPSLEALEATGKDAIRRLPAEEAHREYVDIASQIIIGRYSNLNGGNIR